MNTQTSLPPAIDQGATLSSALRFAGVAILGVGLAFPAIATLLGQALFPAQARGSLIERDGVVVGSSLVAQPFVGDGYFQPRPSAANYDPTALAGSNLAPSNPALRERIAASSAAIAAREGVAADAIPARSGHRLGLGHRSAYQPGRGRSCRSRASRAARGLDVARRCAGAGRDATPRRQPSACSDRRASMCCN